MPLLLDPERQLCEKVGQARIVRACAGLQAADERAHLALLQHDHSLQLVQGFESRSGIILELTANRFQADRGPGERLQGPIVYVASEPGPFVGQRGFLEPAGDVGVLEDACHLARHDPGQDDVVGGRRRFVEDEQPPAQ